MKNLFLNLGCSLDLHNRVIQEKLLSTLSNCGYDVKIHNICCRNPHQLESGAHLLHMSVKCADRSTELYKDITTKSFWEFADSIENFPFPNYQGLKMSLHDPCPSRKHPQIQQAVRSLLKKMNIEIVEAKNHGKTAICCGTNLYGKIPAEKLTKHIENRAASMPCPEVAVYCVACINPINMGGRNPRYILDLMLNQPTAVPNINFEEWLEKLSAHRATRA